MTSWKIRLYFSVSFMFGISWFTAGKVSDYNPFVQVKAHKTSLSCRDFARLDCRKMLAGKPRFCFSCRFPSFPDWQSAPLPPLCRKSASTLPHPSPMLLPQPSAKPALLQGRSSPFSMQNLPFGQPELHDYRAKSAHGYR